MNCQVVNCTRDCKYKKYQFCNLHYQRWLRSGNPGTSLEAQIRDGHTNDYAYKSWAAMKNRCLNPNAEAYKNYGGRGIKVCNRWLDFLKFKTDMGKRPKGTTIERIDTNGNYEPGNCIWASRLEQNNNKRNNISVTIDGITKNVSEWSSISGISYGMIIQRIHRGWSGEKLLKSEDSRYRHKIITPDGFMTVKELSEKYNVKPYLIYQRIDRGLDFDAIVAKPYFRS